MSTAVWSPTTYLAFADERSRPFADLIGRIGATAPRRVVDLGCGPGQLTAGLAQRWPDADVLGLDSSPEMIAAAQAYADARVRFDVADLRTWVPDEPVDVIVTNATLQWVPDHLGLLPRLVGRAGPGRLAGAPGSRRTSTPRATGCCTSSPGTHGSPTRPPASSAPAAPDAATYLGVLAGLGLDVDAWETTYLHVLTGPDPVFRWISGTGARPILQALQPRAARDVRAGVQGAAPRRVSRTAARHRAAVPPRVRSRAQAKGHRPGPGVS